MQLEYLPAQQEQGPHLFDVAIVDVVAEHQLSHERGACCGVCSIAIRYEADARQHLVEEWLRIREVHLPEGGQAHRQQTEHPGSDRIVIDLGARSTKRQDSARGPLLSRHRGHFCDEERFPLIAALSLDRDNFGLTHRSPQIVYGAGSTRSQVMP
jgi:hypothetical protein